MRAAAALKARAPRGPRRAVSGRRASAPRASSSYDGAEFVMKEAPIDLPQGPWAPVPGGVTAAKGFKAAALAAGLRATPGRADAALVVADGDAVSAGVFTTNVVAAAPVQFCKRALGESETARAVLINAGQANAATGDAGWADSVASADAVAAALGVPAGAVLLESTGVIGRRIKMDELLAGVPQLAGALSAEPEAGRAAAVAITTTDLVSKSAALETEIGGVKVRVGGMAKGSGMIHPNMATMLGVVTCDAAVSPDVWRGIVRRACTSTFNQITVDGDTSTNDTVLALASGAAGGATVEDPGGEAAAQLEAAVTALCEGLAKSIAWDGEGATVLIECGVSGAASQADAETVARSVVSSSLAKAAIFGHDPNWGRIACAAGYAGVPFDQAALRIQLGDHLLMEGGQPLAFDKAAASAYLKGKAEVHGTVRIDVSIGDGPGAGTAWGSDLSYEYVRINAEYTT